LTLLILYILSTVIQISLTDLSSIVHIYPLIFPFLFTIIHIRSSGLSNTLQLPLSLSSSISVHSYSNNSHQISPFLFTFIQISLLHSFHYFSHLSKCLSSDLSITVYSYLGIFPLICSFLFTFIQTSLVWSLHYSLPLSTYLSSNLSISVHSYPILPLPFTLIQLSPLFILL